VTDRRTLLERWRRLDVVVRDLPLALLLGCAVVVPGLQDRGTQLGELPNRPFDQLTVLVVVLQCVPLVVRRRSSALCLLVVSIGFVADQLLGYHTVAGTALPIALLSAGAHLSRRRHLAVLLASAAYVGLAVALARGGSDESVVDFVTFYSVLAVAWGAGAWLRRSRAAEEERRVLVAETTRSAERTRIARELHDVVTHHVTAMVVQAEAARYLTGTPDRLEESLTAITDTGRGAISDLRHLLDILDPDHDTAPHGALERPTAVRRPTVGDLRDLADQARRAGQQVELVEEGARAPATGSAEVTTYRVVQEALTNALKHAHGARTVVHVRHGEAETTVEVGTDGTDGTDSTDGAAVGAPTGALAALSGGSGRGLVGLRERVGLLGGDLSAGREADGRFVVRARIPAGTNS